MNVDDSILCEAKLDVRVKMILDNPFEGSMAIDETGTVFFINSFFLEILHCVASDVLGKKIWDVIPSCRLFETIGQGYSIWGETLKINAKEFLVARFPLKTGGQTVGAMVKTLFPDQTIAKEIVHKLARPIKAENSLKSTLCTCRDIIGETPPMLYVKKLARRASRTSSTLLITGESGTGKEVIAQAIHTRSVRREGPFISVNCGAIPENLLESELFGYVDGAFTGAKRGGKPGKFELADGGTILLDEIGDMPLYMQVKLLRVLQDREVWRIGATVPTKLDVRVMASTHTDLVQLVKDKKFREDLYYRLNVLEIKMPALREIAEDLPLLIAALIQRINRKIGADASGVSQESIEIMKTYSWPGNVRELENRLEQAINWSDDHIIDIRNIPVRPWETELSPVTVNDNTGFRGYMQETERDLIVNALEKAQGNKAQAARMLNMQRSVLYKKMGKLSLKV
ncbi:MAG TPA: sigma 54-interacting transcriptional regulator [Negativicutes bacterium]|jgi:transcriptional regulator with PAS, ATPase and Fis domain